MNEANGLHESKMDDDDPRVVAAVNEFMRQLDAGRSPDVERFLVEHTHIAAPLRPALEGLAMLHGAAAKPKTSPALTMPDAEFTGKPIGDFQIVGELGRGGMEIVYEAIQLSLGRRVALKVFPFASGLDASRLQRFRNEAHAAAQLHHTNIVPVHAVGSDRGVQYYAMQLIEGQTLAELISCLRQANSKEDRSDTSQKWAVRNSNSAAPSGDASYRKRVRSQSTVLSTAGEKKKHYRSMVKLAYQACLALEHAHQYGVVHRDIKPGNLLLDGAGKLWVTDFGLAQVERAEMPLTRSGDALGTARYMSPEQAAGNRLILDHRTDIYSLGVTLYELLTLEPAIRGQVYRDMLNQVAEREPLAPKLVDPALPTELETIIRKAIAKEPSQRYATAQAFGDDLLAWLDDKPIAAKPPTAWERLAKWRKRNSRLVNVAAGLLVAASLALLVTTLMVLREQRHTKLALESESRQRAAAEASFQQARRAVDTFSALSETELAYRPEFQNLRRRILETSLEFYRDFLEQRSADLADSRELQATSAKVQRMVEDLKLLDDVAPLLLLADQRVRQELAIDEEEAEDLIDYIDELQSARASLGDGNGLLFVGAGTDIAGLMREFVDQVSESLNPSQLQRLRQIARQQHLPFTFLTTEVGDALKLTTDQRQQISKIIQEERPDRQGRPPGEGGPGREPFGPEFGPSFGRGFGPAGPPPDGFGGREAPPPGRGGKDDRGRRGPPRGGPGDPRGIGSPIDLIVKKTVARILEILTPEQRSTWKELIGEPFEHRLPRELENPPN